MQYLICKCKEPELIIFSLKQLNYDFKNILTGCAKILSGDPYFICINVKDKHYYIYSDIDHICQSGLLDCVYLDDDSEVLNKIGVTNSIAEQRKLLQEYINSYHSNAFSKLFSFSDKPETYFENIPDFFKSTLENTKSKKSEDVYESFNKAIQPGRIVELEINEQRYLGVILTSHTIMYINSQGEVKGYINNFTMDNPYKIKKILVPSDKVFQLKDYRRMIVAWKRPIERVTVRKTIAEIEKELGLKPGTLEIC